MNAAFLMLTSAWLAGADPVPTTPPPAAPAPAVVAGSGCGGGCGATCGDPCCKPSLCDRIKGLFHRDHCGCADNCAPAPAPVCCPAPKPVCCPAPKPVCCPAPKPVCCPAPAPVCAPAPCAPACADTCGKPRLCDRIKGLFHRHGDCGCDAGCGGCGAATPIAPVPAAPGTEPKKMPTTIGSNGVIITPTKNGEETKNPFDLRRRYEGRVSHANDYSTLTGQLIFVHTDGGRWVLRYAPISQEDRFGGSVVFARDIRMDSYSEGDLVSVDGAILSEKSTFPLGGALYQVSKIRLVEKATEAKSE